LKQSVFLIFVGQIFSFLLGDIRQGKKIAAKITGRIMSKDPPPLLPRESPDSIARTVDSPPLLARLEQRGFFK